MNAYRIVIPSLAVLALAAGCSSGGSASAQQPRPDNGGYARGGGNRPGGMPGVTGKIAALDGATLQVQGSTAQTAVTYSAATAFTETVAAAKFAVVAGVCVTVRPVPASAPPTAGSAVAAGAVTVSAAVGGKCGFGFGGPGGMRPSGRPSVRPSGRPRGGRGQGFGASGTVKEVTASGFTVTRPDGSAPIAVTITAATTFTRTTAATKAALAVGKCVTAFGKADDTGTVAATAIAVRPADNGECASGFGGRGRGTDGGN